MERELLPLPADLDQLANAERGFPAVPAELEARLWASLLPQLAGVGPISPTPPPSFPAHAGTLAKLTSKWPLAVAFALGGGAGAGFYAASTTPREVVRIVEVAASDKPPPSVLPPASVTAPMPEPLSHKTMPARERKVTAAPPEPPSTPQDDPSLAAERALLEMGRTALARGQAESAYKVMVEHEQRFPHGRLAEERDAIRIQALASLGQLDAAGLLADTFAKAYPHSLLRPAVEQALTKRQ